MSLLEIEPTPHCSSTTLGELLNLDINVPNKAPKDERNLSPSNISFVLSFNNLSYIVKLGRKLPIPWVFHDHQRVGATTMTPPLTYSSPPLSNAKVLLNDVSGEARSGEILAVLGSSGSGKTTLLDALANRITKEKLQGTITLNGARLESRLLKSISAYVMQDDMLFPMLTVEETLTFASEFRLPYSLSKLERRERVEALIKQLGLENAANTIIGDEGHRGVSGGERRRVSIGIEIISQPIILFLDEPTSGLDSTSAYMVVKVLKRVAQSGSMVIMSIHQPSYPILGLIDRVIFLSYGQTIYSGTSINLPSFFHDFGYPLSNKRNWAEFTLDLIQDLHDSGDGVQAMVDFNKSYHEMKGRYRSSSIIETNPSEGSSSLEEAIKLKKPTQTSALGRFANPFWREVGILLRRSFTSQKRIQEAFATLFVTVTFTGVLLATIFWQLPNTPKGIVERFGFYMYALTGILYVCLDAFPALILHRYIFIRETASNAYRRSSYVVAHALVSMQTLVIISLAFCSVTFWTVGLGGGLSGFFFYIIIIVASFWAGNSYVTFVSGFITRFNMCFIVVIGGISYFNLYSGFFVNRDQIPRLMLWFYYVSLVKYPYQATLINEFQDPLKCFTRGIQIFDGTEMSVAPNDVKEMALVNLSGTMGMNISGTTCFVTGADILKQHGITDMSKWGAILVIVGYGVFFRVLFYLVLLFGSKNKRK